MNMSCHLSCVQSIETDQKRHLFSPFSTEKISSTGHKLGLQGDNNPTAEATVSLADIMETAYFTS